MSPFSLTNVHKGDLKHHNFDFPLTCKTTTMRICHESNREMNYNANLRWQVSEMSDMPFGGWAASNPLNRSIRRQLIRLPVQARPRHQPDHPVPWEMMTPYTWQLKGLRQGTRTGSDSVLGWCTGLIWAGLTMFGDKGWSLGICQGWFGSWYHGILASRVLIYSFLVKCQR